MYSLSHRKTNNYQTFPHQRDRGLLLAVIVLCIFGWSLETSARKFPVRIKIDCLAYNTPD